MLMFFWIYFLVLLFMSLMMFIKFKKHVLMILLSLEFFVVIMFYGWYIYFNLMNLNQFLSLYYLVFSVCESVLGLTIMIIIVRSEGADYLQSFNLLKW
uniref:NADH-ubiquinone oxidoreductase chain 4L n=1 Tax=Janus sp. TaxID=3003420 RepID=A0A9E8YXG7_9HYME|nr:NADH dehydrogenase subunit 4L [Janus sp.]